MASEHRQKQVTGRRGRQLSLLGALLITMCPVTGTLPVARAQQSTNPSPSYTPPGYTRSGSNPSSMSRDPLDPAHPGRTGIDPMKLEHMREDERRKRLQSDTTRLVELTNELKTEVDKASKDELSLDVVRKAAEIEKLARDVKDRMKS